jgi:hypothetical protein
VLALSQADFTSTDLLVIPEIFVPAIAKLAPGVSKVIYNQNAYFTFRGWPLDADGFNPYRHPDVVATLSVSEDNLAYLSYAFPGLRMYRVHHGIDSLFAPLWPKQRKITYMPRKNAEDVGQVLNLLRSRGALSGWTLESIDGRSEHEVAERLSSCAIFLSFGNPEGFSLPPLEAMACGCVVVGYHGRGGKEYFDPSFSYPIEAGDIIGFAQAIEELLRSEQTEPGILERKGRKATEFVRANFSPEREFQEIGEIWREIMALRRRPAEGS